MLPYTIKPTPKNYNTICRRLIHQYPTLKDHNSECKFTGTFTGTFMHVILLFIRTMQDSWKKLRNKFKNIRRPDQIKRLNETYNSDPPPKKIKVDLISKNAVIEPSASDKAIIKC